MQVMLDHLRGLQRDVHLLMAGRHPQARGGFQRSAALVRALREVRRRAVRAGGPGQVRSRGALLLTGLRPPLPRSGFAGGGVRPGRSSADGAMDGVASVTAQTAPQFPDLFSYVMPPNESVRLAAERSS